MVPSANSSHLIRLQRPTGVLFNPVAVPNWWMADLRSGQGMTCRRDRWVERLKGIEPSSSDWKSEALPLSYSRETLDEDPSSTPLTWGYARIKSLPPAQCTSDDHNGSSTVNPTGDPHWFR